MQNTNTNNMIAIIEAITIVVLLFPCNSLLNLLLRFLLPALFMGIILP